jgi:hypothetical protein
MRFEVTILADEWEESGSDLVRKPTPSDVNLVLRLHGISR